ncbi:hypothetical protein MCMEM_1534 [Methanococcoides methylutens MM1]|uniref:LamG-like jellyroll fold domain-containing protein n=1 Tax=Methanococcoides methylutens MM1 TaxID=1434104 RepID=A0A0E3SSU9_METMT|nr:hypothetical protein MCMEM_1534 [Methanococcoides methylutens MM1]
MASPEGSVTLYDGNALEFKTPPDVVAYANTLYSEPPNEFKITTSGNIWQYKHWIALTDQGDWIEAKTGIETTTVGVQFWGDINGGWARVLVDGEKVWSGDTYGGDSKFPEGKFIKYLEISGLDKGFHTIRVENMGVSSKGGGDDVIVYFFSLMEPSVVEPEPTPTPEPTQVSEKELVAYYPFDGNVKDYSGNDNHAFNDGATFVSGAREQALSFDGKGDYVRSPVNIDTDNMPQMTMIAWAKADEVRGTVISHDDGNYDRTIAIDDSGDGVGWSAFSGSGGVLGSYPVTTDEWVFLAAVYDQDAETVTLYVNDKVYEEKGKIGSGRDYTIIGSNPESGLHFSGDIDEMRIYNYALSQSEINSLRKEVTPPAPEPIPVDEKELVAYYPLDGNVKDHSGNDNHGFNDGATFVSGAREQALSFDGKDDYLRSQVNINPDNMPQMTMVAWAKADEVRGTVISHDDGSYDRTISIDDSGDGVGWSAFGGSGGILGSYPVTSGEWTFLAAVYDQDAETVTLYVNDKVYEEKGKIGSGQDYTIIGSNPESGLHFSGDIDEVRIYNYALSQSEIDSLRKEVAITIPEQIITQEPIADGFNGLIFESRSKANGSIVQIPLTLNGIGENIGNIDMTLRYNSSVLAATEVVKGSLTSNSLLNYNIVDSAIKINIDDKDGFSGDGSVAYVRFNVVGTEGSYTSLDITSLSANRVDQTPFNIATKDGMFKVISLEESKGDAVGDGGELTALDALYALQMSVRMIPEDLAMDMDGDGSVTSNDARLILKSSVKSD